MWIHLDPPHDFIRDDAEGWRRARHPSGRLVLAWSPLRLLPDHQAPWFDSVVMLGLPPGATCTERTVTRATTVSGWDVAFIETKVVKNGALLATRLVAFYAFLEHGGSALVHADDPSLYAEEVGRLRRILLEARPDFSGSLLSVEDFFQGADDGDDE